MMHAAKDWLRRKTQMMAMFVQRSLSTASSTRAHAFDLSRRDGIFRIQKMDALLDMSVTSDSSSPQDMAVSAASCACRAAILAKFAKLDIRALQSLMESLVGEDYVAAAMHLDRIMDDAGFSGGQKERNKVIRLCEERAKKERKKNCD